MLTDNGDAVTKSAALDFSNITERTFSRYYFYPDQELYPYESRLILMGRTDTGYLFARTVHGNASNLPV